MAVNKTEVIITAVDKTSSAVNAATASLSKLGQVATGLAPQLAAAFSGAAISAFVKSAVDAADEFNDLAQKTGVSVKNLAAFKLAAEQSGTGMDTVAKGMRGLASEMVNNADAFKKLGIDTRDTDKAMRQIADLFADLPDGVDKAALSSELFGKKIGSELIPLLNLGSQGLDKSAQAAERYGEVMAAMAAPADQFNDTLAEIGLNAAASGAELASALLPTLQVLADELLDASKNSYAFKTAGEGLNQLLMGLAATGAAVATTFSVVGKTIGAAAAQLVAVGSGNFSGALEIGSAWQADIAKAKTSFDDFVLKLGQPVNVAAADGIKATGKASDDAKKRAAAFLSSLKTGAAAAKKPVDDLAQVLNRLNAKDTGLAASYWQDLQTLFAGYQSGRLSVDAYRDAVEKLTTQQKFHTDAVTEAKKHEEAYQREMEKSREAVTRSIEAIEDRARAAEEENANYGRTASEIESVTIARLEEQRAIADGFDSQAELVANLDREISARQRLRSALQTNEVLDAGKKAAEESAKAWEKFTDDIEKSLTDSLYRAFEAGDDFGEAFAKSLQNTFKAMVLKFAVQMTVNSAGSAVSSMTGTSGTDAGSALNTASNAASLFNVGTGVGASAASLAAANVAGAVGGDAIGTLIAGNAASWGVSSAGVGAGSAALGAVAAAAPYLAAAVAVYSLLDGIGAFGGKREYTGASNVVGTFTGSGFQGDIGRPWTKDGGWFGSDREGVEYDAITGQLDGALDALAVAAAAQFRALADVFDDDTVGPAIERFSFTLRRDVSSGLESAWQGIADDLYSGLADAVFPSLAGLRQSGEAMATTFTRVVAETNAVSRVAELMGKTLRGAFGGNDLNTILMLSDSLVQMAGGMDAFNAQFSAYYDAYYDAEEKTGQLRDDLTASFAAMQLELPKSKDQFREIVESLDLTTVSGQQTFAVMMRIAPQFADLAAQIDATATAAAEAAARMAAERQTWQGKLDLLTGSATERQQALQADLASTTDAVTQALMRQVYAQEDLNAAAAGRQTWQGMLDLLTGSATERQQALQADLASTTDAVTQALMRQVYAQEDLNAAAEAAAQQAAAIAQQRGNLEVALLQAQGDTAALRARELSALDESNRALQEQIWALNDEAAAAQSAAQAAASIASERYGLQTQLLQAQGDTAALRARELSALDESNRALQEQIWALNDAAEASRLAKAAAEEEARAKAEAAAEAERIARAIAQERQGLENRILQLQGNTVELRARELAALNPVNRALQEQIWLLEDQAAAAQKAAAVESERLGLQKQLWQAQGNTAALRAAELAALDPANRALQKQIWLLQDQQAAASEWASTWKGITDGLREQARQLRGDIAGQNDYARLQAQFALDTAAARAGDAGAAGRLSGLSADVLASYTGQAASSLDVARLSASLATSLEATAGVIDAGAPRDATADEIRGLREEQRVQSATMARLLTSMEKIYARWDRDGLPAERLEV